MSLFNPVGQQGSIGLNPRGIWLSGSTYNRSDAVSRNGGSYVALTNALTGSGTDPLTDPTDWMQLAAPGASSATGIQLIRMGAKNFATSSSTFSTWVITVTGTHTQGNTLVFYLFSGANNPAPTISSIVDSRSNTYTVDKTISGTYGSGVAALWVGHAPLTTALQPADTITFTLSSAVANLAAGVLEFSNVPSSSPTDVTSSGASTSSVTTIDGGTTAVTAQTNELAVSAFTISPTTGVAPGAGFILADAYTFTGTVTRGVGIMYQIIPTVQTVHATVTTPSAQPYVAATAVYK